MRLNYEELNKIKLKYGVDQLWSFSKYNCYRTSMYEYLLKYILKRPENTEKISAYAPMGSICHSLHESFYQNELKYEELANEFDDAFMTNIDIMGLSFDRSDSVKNENIKTKYYNNLIHYFKNFTPMKEKPILEQFLTIKITDDIVFQGYADCIVKDSDGNVIVKDFKTSTLYTGEKRDKEAAQLVLYAEALRQKGVPKEKIKASWIFLKYVQIDCKQVNGKIKQRIVERCEIGSSLQASAKVWLNKLGYKDDLLFYLDALVQSNDISCLPQEVQIKFKISDCEVYIENIWDLYDKLKEEIIQTVTDINKKVEQYNALKDSDLEAAEKLFWDDDESLKKQSYYYNNLCGYSIPTIKPYKDYLDRITVNKNDNIFINNSVKKEEDDDDMAWLSELLN